MKMNAKMIGYMLVCILALYGVIILIRKIMHDKTEDQKNMGLKYYVEPYSWWDKIKQGAGTVASGALELGKAINWQQTMALNQLANM